MIGIYGGTFDPIHYGHLRTAVEIKHLFALQEVRFIPSAHPPHREAPMTTAEQRLAMLSLAIQDQPGFVADDCEIRRMGPSYMVHTLEGLRERFDNQPLLLFMGADAFAGLQSWYQWQRLFSYAHIVVMTRPGYVLAPMQDFLKERLVAEREQLQRTLAGKLFFQAVTLLEISASAIRTQLAENQDPRFLLPDSVLAYIYQQNLYESAVDSATLEK